MGNIVPFDGGNLPAYVKNLDTNTLNDDLTAHAGAGFPVISIKGKVFSIVRDGDRKILPNPKDPDSPANFIDVVVVKANKATSKQYYSKGYTEGSEAGKPECFSNDGVAPDASSETPQAKLCGTCKHNVWGSKVSIDGTGGKGKACQDGVRMAISTLDAMKEPYLIRVPPASIRALGEYGKMLKARGVKYNMVVTRISFDPEAPTPKLLFKPMGFLPEDAYTKMQGVAAMDVVSNILGSAGVPTEADVVDTPAPIVSATPAVKLSATASVEKAKPATKAKAAVDPEVEIDLDSLKFDD